MWLFGNDGLGDFMCGVSGNVVLRVVDGGVCRVVANLVRRVSRQF